MTDPKKLGRILGVLIIVQGLGGYIGNFVLLSPVLTAPGGFLANAAAHEMRVRLAVLAGLAAGAMSLGIAITAARIFRRHSESLALWFVCLSAVGFAVTSIEQIGLLAMLAVSQKLAAAVASPEAYQAAGEVARASRNAAHYTNLMIVGAGLVVMHSTLFRFKLVPRALAGLGILGALMQFSAVSMPMLGRPINMNLLTPLGIAQLSLALWLLAKGFPEQRDA